jgi:histidinol-phosphate aminotransferase
VGLLDYYRQFSGMSDEEVGAELRERAADRRAKALAKVETLDLSGAHWHEFPHPDVVAAITFAARRALNRAPDPHALELRQEIAMRFGVEPERVVAGHGAAQLLQSALRTLLAPGDEAILPWPTYGLLPPMVRRAGGRPVPVEGGLDPDRLLSAVTADTRVLALANPNDPTGERVGADVLRRLADGLPDRAWLVVDEALADFVGGDRDDALELLDDYPQMLVVRTLSKAYGLAGLRCGWAIGPADAAEDLAGVAPAGALATPVQVGALEALTDCGPLVARRREQVRREREKIVRALDGTRYHVAPSDANILWLRLPGTSGRDLADRLGGHAVRVAPGTEWGDADHVRVQVQSEGATDRLLRALEGAAA